MVTENELSKPKKWISDKSSPFNWRLVELKLAVFPVNVAGIHYVLWNSMAYFKNNVLNQGATIKHLALW